METTGRREEKGRDLVDTAAEGLAELLVSFSLNSYLAL